MRVCPQCSTRFIHDEPFCPHDGSQTREQSISPGRDPLLGTTIDNRYRVEEQIGEGGMGVVYLVTHATLGSRRALKVLRGEMARDGEVVSRFLQEATSASKIGHENIIDIYDFGKLPDGSVYFVMELLEGDALTKRIATGGSMPMQEAVPIIRQIASALGAAHTRGIVHRDLKPDNIYVVKRGDNARFVKVLDFGIAKVGGAASKLTKTGVVFGTPHYMAPEQAAGQSVDQRADIYALGVIMYEIFTGRVPFDADTFMAILTKHMFEAPPPLAASPEMKDRLGALEDITLRALAKKPEDRYQTMLELIEDLDRVAAGGQAAMPGNRGGLANALEPPSRDEIEVAGRVPRSKMPLVAAGIAAVLVLGGGGVYVAMQSSAGATSGNGSEQRNAPRPVPGIPTTTTGTNAADPTIPTAPTPPTPPTVPEAPQRVQITSDPPGAEVYSNDALVGTTPLEMIRPADERRLEVRLAGHRTETVLLHATSPESIPVSLHRNPTKRSSGGGGQRAPRRQGDVIDPFE